MPRKAESPEQLLDRVLATGYEPGVHELEDSVRDITTYVDKTLYDQNWALERYQQWLKVLEVKRRRDAGKSLYSGVDKDNDIVSNTSQSTQPPCLKEDGPPLSLATIKDFLRFHISLSKGRIDDEKRTTVDSVNTFSEWFFAGITRVTGNVIDTEDRAAVYDWVRKTLTKEGLVVKKHKKKHLFGEKEMIQFTITFWTADDAVFVHPRNKAQIPWLIDLFVWTGARIGAFLTDTKTKSKGGLRYRDIDLVLKRIPGGSWKVIYRVDQRWVKNNRDPENIVFGASTSQHRQLLKDGTQFLLALALADRAFQGITSAADLWATQIPEGEDELLLRWTDDVQFLPIVRNATMQNGVTKEPLSKATFSKIVKSVLNLSGFFEGATVHAIRRYVGKQINERYTEVQRSQHLTQADRRVFGRDYMASTSDVCGKTAFWNEPAEHDHVDFFQSFAKLREKGLPSSLPAEKEAAVRQDPQLLVLEREIERLRSDGAPASEIKAATGRARNYRSGLRKRILQQYKLEWVRQRRDWKVATRGKEKADDTQTTDLLDVLSSVMPERRRLTKTMISDKVVSEQDRRQAVEDLCFLASQDTTTFYLPGEKPIDGVCPSDGCGVRVGSLAKRQRSTHIHECHRKDFACTLERLPSELRYCYTCFDWFVEEEWDEHCQMHVTSLTSKRCATITYCHTLVRPAFCPFCLGNRSEPASRRWESWTREAKVWAHLRTHLDVSRWPLRCPHPLCNLQVPDEISFLYHLSDIHSLQMSPQMGKSWQSERHPEPLVKWIPDTASNKRKRQDGDGQDLQPSKRSKDPLQLHWRHKQSPDPSRGRKAPDKTQATQSPGSSQTSFTHVVTDEDIQDLPELTHSESMSPPDTDELHSMDDLCLRQNVLQKQLQSELEWLSDAPETKSDEHGSPLPGEDVLFSQYLRSRSPSCFSAQGTSGRPNVDEEIHSQTVAPSDTCLHTGGDPLQAVLIDQNTANPKNLPLKTNRPRVALRIRPPKLGPKLKVLLRLSQPKRIQAQTVGRHGIKDRKRRRT